MFHDQRNRLESPIIKSVAALKSLVREKSRREKIIEAAKRMSEISIEELKTSTVNYFGKRFKGKIGPKDFDILQALGRGSFGTVLLVRYKRTKKLYAMKILNKELYRARDTLRYAKAERDVLSSVKSHFIVKLDFAFQTAEELVLVIEYCAG
jgi:serine/threonine protein kinase